MTEDTEVIGLWNREEVQQSSIWREAEAVNRVLRSNIDVLKDKSEKWYTDNKNVKRILNSGSKKSHLITPAKGCLEHS